MFCSSEMNQIETNCSSLSNNYDALLNIQYEV